MSGNGGNGNGGADRSILTAKGIAAMSPGEVASDPAARGAGRLEVRMGADGEPAFYYRYTAPGGSRVRIAIGAGITLADARRTAHRLSVRYQAGDRDLRPVLEAEHREAARAREAAKLASEAAAVRQQSTLGRLLSAYVQQLERDGKPSARKVARSITVHIAEPWPKLWAMPAADVGPDDLFVVVAKLTDDGKRREAEKVCAYIKAAYAAAIRSRMDMASLPELRALRLSSNPARDLIAPKGGSVPGERALSAAELRGYWRRIERMPGAIGGLLRLHLLTGCQRLEQLSRLTKADLDSDLVALVLRDGKGRRTKPRLHVVPLIPAALDALHQVGGGDYLFSVRAGEEGVDTSTVRKYVRRVASEMFKAGELTGGMFSPRDLRRSIETRLAALGISKDVRAHLQSHGLGGVQDRHYDKHDYLEEKRRALEALFELLNEGSP